MSTPRHLRSKPRPFDVRQQTGKGVFGGTLTKRASFATAQTKAREWFRDFAEPVTVYKGNKLLFRINKDGTEETF